MVGLWYEGSWGAAQLLVSPEQDLERAVTEQVDRLARRKCRRIAGSIERRLREKWRAALRGGELAQDAREQRLGRRVDGMHQCGAVDVHAAGHLLRHAVQA